LEQVEFVLSVIKITACIGFMILGIIIDCGGVPTDTRGYIGAKYWYAQTFDVATGKANNAI
jgi:amino acid transporter